MAILAGMWPCDGTSLHGFDTLPERSSQLPHGHEETEGAIRKPLKSKVFVKLGCLVVFGIDQHCHCGNVITSSHAPFQRIGHQARPHALALVPNINGKSAQKHARQRSIPGEFFGERLRELGRLNGTGTK
ncbi:MAG: hypothetical protein WCG26_11685 [Chloroflexales bacterium]